MSLQDKQWRTVCTSEDLIDNSGVCVLLNEDTENEQQVALFYVTVNGGTEKKLYAVSNYDPIGKANVMYRGIIGYLGGRYVIASPLYKQHFDLETGKCVEDENAALTTYDIRLTDDNVELFF